MADSTDRTPIERVVRAKEPTEGPGTITGLKLVGFGIQLTLIGGFVPELRFLVYAGVVLSLVGLLVR